MQKNVKRRGLSLLLIVAMLFVAISVLIPVVTSATPDEIDDVGVQALSDFSVSDVSTDLRFMFSINSLEYVEVGFVFSKTNTNPTVGGTKCYKKTVNTVYRSIMSGGTPVTPESGNLYWVAVKLTEIPNEYYGGMLYARPFVIDGAGTRYADAVSTNVWDQNVNIRKYTTSSKFNNDAKMNLESHNIYTDVLNSGAKHFYPTSENPDGNDLFIEYSFLWNETFAGLNNDNKQPILNARISCTAGNNDLSWMSLIDDANGSAGPFAGCFEYGGLQTVEVGPEGMAPTVGDTYQDFPNIGGTDPDHPEWGWHRVGIRFHQEVSNAAKVKTGSTPKYRFFVEIYIDGELSSRLSNATKGSIKSGNSLFTVSKDYSEGATEYDGLYYSDVAQDVEIWGVRVQTDKTSSGVAYFAYADYSVTCGQDFVLDVSRVDYPEPTYMLFDDGTSRLSSTYFTKTGVCEHEWDGVYTTAVSASNLLANDGTKVQHCTKCGQASSPVAGGAYVPNVQSWSSKSGGHYTPNSATVGDVRGSDHFYEDGNDLLVEYSVLWNSTVPNLRPDGNPYLDTRFSATKRGGEPTKNIIYWSLADNVSLSDCKFAGGFEWGGIDHAEADCPYPRFTGDNEFGGIGTEYGHYPNIGGTDEEHPEWGWHRVGIRYREEVVNKADLMADETPGATDPIYNLEMWVYIDGVLVIHASQTDLQKWADANENEIVDAGEMHDRKLFTAESDGNGGIDYTENDDVFLVGTYVNTIRAQNNKIAYFAIADFSATVGSAFVQDVQKVTSPTPATITVSANEVTVESTIWYELKP